MAFTSKAALTAPAEDFARTRAAQGVWKRNTVTSCYFGQKITLKTAEPAPRTCVCDLIRVGDEFFVAHGIGDARKLMREYEDIWAQVAARAQVEQQAA